MEPTIKYENCDDMYGEQETNVRQRANEMQGNNMPSQHYYDSHQQQQNNLKRVYNDMENGRNMEPQQANGSYYPPVDFPALPQHLQDNFDMFNHPNSLLEPAHSTFRPDNKPLKKYKRGEASLLFNPPFFKLLEDFSSPAHKDAIAARCYACGKVVKGNRSISSNFIKHMKRGHPDISKIYDTYKIYRIKTGLLPNVAHMLEEKMEMNKPGGGGGGVNGMGTGSGCGDSNDDNNSFFDATTILDSSEVGDDDKQSENSEDNEDSLNITRENSENNENSKESQQHQHQYENKEVELSAKTLETIGKLMDDKLRSYVKQTEFEKLALKVDQSNGHQNVSPIESTSNDTLNSSAALSELKKELENLKHECSSLRLAVHQAQASKRQLQNELQTVDKMLHQRKLIIRNLKIFDIADPKKSVEKLFQERLNLENVKIVNCSVIPTPKSTTASCKECISIELQNHQDVKLIFRQTHKLKDTGIFIESEISPFQRKRKDKLMVLRKELLRRKADLKVLVRNTTLVVNGKHFYWDDVEGLCHDSNKDAIELNAVEYLKSLTTLDLKEFVNILQNYDIQMR